MDVLDLTGDSDGETDTPVASSSRRGTAEPRIDARPSSAFAPSGKLFGGSGLLKPPKLNYAPKSNGFKNSGSKREFGDWSASFDSAPVTKLGRSTVGLEVAPEASPKRLKLAAIDTADQVFPSGRNSPTPSSTSSASPLSPASASYLLPAPLSNASAVSRPSQRSFIRTSAAVSSPLPFPVLALVYCKPISGSLPGDHLRYSVHDLFGDGGAVNERAIVSTMGIDISYVSGLIQRGQKRPVESLFIYDELSKKDKKELRDYESGPVVMHKPKGAFGLVGNHAKFVLLARRASDGTRYLWFATANFNVITRRHGGY